MNYRTLPLLLLTLLCTSVRAQKEDTKTENVIIITMDGLRWQELFGGAVDSMVMNPDLTSDADRIKASYIADDQEERRASLMPFFWETIATQGQVFGNRWLGSQVNCTNRYWFSYPGYNEILTGYTDGAINSNAKNWNPNKTVLEWLHEKPEFQGRVAAFGSWDVFDWIVNEQRSGIPVNSGYNKAEGDQLTDKEHYLNKLQDQTALLWGSVRQDFLTHNYMMEYLKREHPKVVYISYGETDDFAHDGAYHRYLDAAHATDGMWRELWTFLQNDPVYAGKTSLIITTDHGRGESPMTEWKSHGTRIKGADAIWMAVLGPDTPAKGVITQGQLYQTQIAKTAAALLGYDYVNEKEEVGAVVPGVIATKK
ncbi:MAG: phosphoglyceromutase [Lewinella sp.]|nr:phosphoglyceromutase [Lewinella sp.]